jgi:hypothetical protein
MSSSIKVIFVTLIDNQKRIYTFIIKSHVTTKPPTTNHYVTKSIPSLEHSVAPVNDYFL